jgi:deoxyhypusine monooxygenase
VELALGRIKHVTQSQDPVNEKSPYLSVDPALPLENCKDIGTLENVLLDESLSLYERYQAMFTLRDIGSSESIHALGKGNYPCNYQLIWL